MVGSAAIATGPPTGPGGSGIRRSRELLRAFRLEQSDPDAFYTVQAADAVAQAAHYLPLPDAVILDIGGGAGYFTAAFRAAGARCYLVEPDAGISDHLPAEPATAEERHRRAVRPARLVPRAAVAGDGLRLPFPDGVADLTFSSNVLEHVPDPDAFLDESVRVTRPGGLLYLSFTVWLSPWGGHETAPWHYFGGTRAARRFHRRHGRPPGNLYGSSLFACHVGPTLRRVRARTDVEVVDARPRYYPDWLRWIVDVPAVRELATWNLLLMLRRTGP